MTTHTPPTPPTPPAALPARLYPFTTPTGSTVWTTPTDARANHYTPESTTGVNVPHRATFTYAADTDGATELARRIVAYLPHGWYIHTVGRDIGIYGNDRAGWTLHEYTLPRLASGCIYPTAITPEATQ